jgi:hypothetical protein
MKNIELLTKRFEKNIAGVLNCFDRLVLFGTYQPICYPQAMSWQLHEAGIQLIDYEKKFANKLRLEMNARIKAISKPLSLKYCPLVVMLPALCAFSAPWRAAVALRCVRIIRVVISNCSGNQVNVCTITCI